MSIWTPKPFQNIITFGFTPRFFFCSSTLTIFSGSKFTSAHMIRCSLISSWKKFIKRNQKVGKGEITQSIRAWSPLGSVVHNLTTRLKTRVISRAVTLKKGLTYKKMYIATRISNFTKRRTRLETKTYWQNVSFAFFASVSSFITGSKRLSTCSL
jgi:hypothetical protein